MAETTTQSTIVGTTEKLPGGSPMNLHATVVSSTSANVATAYTVVVYDSDDAPPTPPAGSTLIFQGPANVSYHVGNGNGNDTSESVLIYSTP